MAKATRIITTAALVAVCSSIPTVLSQSISRTDAHAGGNARTARHAPALLVVDDSGDMEGNDGFEPTPNGRWPILTYVSSIIGSADCTRWSMYRRMGLNAPQEPCGSSSFRVRPLTATSPLTEVVAAACLSPQPRDVYFLTNGLDWLTEGKNADFRVEMNVGRQLCEWTNGAVDRDVIIGSILDRRGRHRPILLIGLVHHEPVGSDECGKIPENLPKRFEVAIARYPNPQRELLTAGAVRIGPTVKLIAIVGGRQVTRPLAVELDGTVLIPSGLANRMREAPTEVEIEIVHPSSGRALCFTSVAARFRDGHQAVAMCGEGPVGTALCRLRLPQTTSSQSLSMELMTSLVIPQWSTSGSLATEAMQQTLDSWRSTCGRSLPVTVARLNSKASKHLTFVFQR